MYLRSLSLQEQHLGTSHAQVGYTLERLSRVFAVRHESAKAADALQRAIEVHEQSLGAAHRAVGDDLSALGRLYLGLGRYGDAEAALRRAISIHQQSLPQDNAAILMDRDGLAQALRLQQRESKPCSRTPPCRG
jgi:tetratricopeptide (TPR) repeat protein